MEITSVKIQQNGWLLNSTMSVPNVAGNREREAILDWIAEGNTPEPQYTDAELLAQSQQVAKQARLQSLDYIKVTTASGKVFDGRDIDQERMVSLILSSGILNITETKWKLADNSIATVSIDELKEALALSIKAVSNIIVGA
ncbi:MAG: hypothetical protein JHC33_09130 [Ignisphaera sp.]|nr:hypothetical protein [Ignisphaera sp.]